MISSIPQSLVRKMVDVLRESPQPKVSGSMNKYYLCQMILSEATVEVTASDLVSLAASTAGGSANMATLFLTQVGTCNISFTRTLLYIFLQRELKKSIFIIQSTHINDRPEESLGPQPQIILFISLAIHTELSTSDQLMPTSC